MKYILKILLFLIICDACKRSDIDVFDIVEEITDYDSVYSDKNDVFNRITDMAILDSVLITKHMNDTYHFSFIDVNGKKIIKNEQNGNKKSKQNYFMCPISLNFFLLFRF